MNKLNTLLFFFSILSFNLFSQNIARQVIGSTGNIYTNGNIILHSTTGQPPLAGTTAGISSLTGNNYYLRQGFQQPFKLNLYTTSTNDLITTNTIISPNPATDHTRIISSEKIQSYIILDTKGKKLFSNLVDNKSTEITTTNLPKATYIIEVYFDSGKIQRFQLVVH